MRIYNYIVLVLVVLLSGCECNDPIIYTGIDAKQGVKEMKKITIKSSAFEDGGTIPSKYTCEGADISPALTWHGVPKDAKTLVLICDDPDAPMGTWVHWVVFNIPVDVTGFPEAVDVENQFNAIIGTNSWGKQTYGGPCPPSGVHRYYFKLYALDRTLKLDEQATKEDVLHAMKDAILAQAQIMGRYKKSGK